MYNLASVSFVNVSPFEHPIRTAIFALPILIFSFWSLQFFRTINQGATLVFDPGNFLITLRIKPGKYSLTTSQKKLGFRSSFNSPASSAFLGLLLFASAEFLLVLLFKSPEYIFLV